MMDYETKTAKITYSNLGIPCLICGSIVPIYHPSQAPKICEKCKGAVMLIRNMMENPKKPILDGGITEL